MIYKDNRDIRMDDDFMDIRDIVMYEDLYE